MFINVEVKAMAGQINEDIMDRLKKTCVCKGISRAVIKKAILDGAKTVEDVQRATGAGSGGCQGRRCNSKIQDVIDETGKG